MDLRRLAPLFLLLLPGPRPHRVVAEPAQLFVQFGHSTPAMRSVTNQVSTKVASEGVTGNADHLGIRFKDEDRDSRGFIGGEDVALDQPFRIVLRFQRALSTATPGEDFEFLDGVGTPLTIDPLTDEFELEVPLLETGMTATGAILRIHFLRNGGPEPLFERVRFALDRIELDGPGEVPHVGWNSQAAWWIQDRP